LLIYIFALSPETCTDYADAVTPVSKTDSQYTSTNFSKTIITFLVSTMSQIFCYHTFRINKCILGSFKIYTMLFSILGIFLFILLEKRMHIYITILAYLLSYEKRANFRAFGKELLALGIKLYVFGTSCLRTSFG